MLCTERREQSYATFLSSSLVGNSSSIADPFHRMLLVLGQVWSLMLFQPSVKVQAIPDRLKLHIRLMGSCESR